MGLPYARVEIGETAAQCRVWLIHDELGEIEVTNFCQAVRKQPTSPKVVVELVANNGPDLLERGFVVDVNTGTNEETL
jgi:ABC-type enterochelin transport system substrate-binding protein